MKAKEYSRRVWRNINLKELNKHLLTHKVSFNEIEHEIMCNEKRFKKQDKPTKNKD